MPKTILLVDDENTVLLTLRMILKGADYDVTTAKSGAEALKILAERSFDAVLTDLNMEREDIGLEVAQAAVMKKPRPAVIVCTGYASIKNSTASLKMGVDYMAHKPMPIEDLIAALDKLLALRDQRY